ncbi:MAG: FAD-dependent oxidoreductase, partial [Planctomycetota bacterium]
MTKANRVDRRKFLTAAGAVVAGTGAAGTLTCSAFAQSIRTNHKRVSIPYNPEVLVVGGGPAGIGAALGAARKGARTLLIENHGFFGSVASWCLGMPINQMRPDSQPRSKIHELIIEKLKTYGEQA